MAATRGTSCGVSTRAGWGFLPGSPRPALRCMVRRFGGRGEQASPHTSFGSVANRVSYLLNLRGPSMPIDTMCSASLTAIHEACEHLYRGECELALAGGVNLYLHPRTYVELCGLRMLSKDGRCQSFGQGGDGFVPGEGVGRGGAQAAVAGGSGWRHDPCGDPRQQHQSWRQDQRLYGAQSGGAEASWCVRRWRRRG